MAIPYNYKYNGKELQETGMYDYGARFYMPDIGRWGVHDPLSDATLQPYSYTSNNPIFYNDPTGMISAPTNNYIASIGVIQNKNGDYEIISAKNDGDIGIYLADANGNYDIKKSKRVGTLNNSFDFLLTNDETGKFLKGVAHRQNGSNITLTTSLNLSTLLYKYAYDTDNDIENYYLDLMNLAYMSANYNGRSMGKLDLKKSLGLDIYTPVRAGKNITSLRVASNILFGFNMRKIYEKYKNNTEFTNKFPKAEDFYIYAMQAVGGYNQFRNNRANFFKGDGYNQGFPFYGEHTYSGTNIYRGYFHQFTNQKLSR
ncbi:RHS repeat-associated protein [Chryseobacterium defluvii]|uniref:RHS repeat-associated protein n=1 Tax=Chryseobacterium defluvii TaxID=160396 RepID=A0A840KG47_9FLAO|nr:RHS repeat-associated core domain-containing protein [Chryseobacterium defluvii]MBB4806998.1 RHS repeat-associated protein [Chryseobacterium defluvii]